MSIYFNTKPLSVYLKAWTQIRHGVTWRLILIQAVHVCYYKYVLPARIVQG